MKKLLSKSTAFALGLMLLVELTNCKKDAAPSVSELIKKTWIPQTVREGNSVVYTKGAATNVKAGYGNFVLNLSGGTLVSLTELEGTTFSGTYEVVNDNKLVLRGLSPKPTGTDGTLEYTIGSVSDANLELTRTSASQKTGGSLNSYSLIIR